MENVFAIPDRPDEWALYVAKLSTETSESFICDRLENSQKIPRSPYHIELEKIIPRRKPLEQIEITDNDRLYERAYWSLTEAELHKVFAWASQMLKNPDMRGLMKLDMHYELCTGIELLGGDDYLHKTFFREFKALEIPDDCVVRGTWSYENFTHVHFKRSGPPLAHRDMVNFVRRLRNPDHFVHQRI